MGWFVSVNELGFVTVSVALINAPVGSPLSVVLSGISNDRISTKPGTAVGGGVDDVVEDDEACAAMPPTPADATPEETPTMIDAHATRPVAARRARVFRTVRIEGEPKRQRIATGLTRSIVRLHMNNRPRTNHLLGNLSYAELYGVIRMNHVARNSSASTIS